MIEQASGRNGHNVILQILQVVNSNHLLHGIRVAEDKVAKTKESLYQSSQVDGHFLGVLVDKMCMTFIGQLSFLRLGGVQDEGYIRVVGADGTQQLESGIFVFLCVWHQREPAVADDSQRIVGKSAV